MEKKQIMKEHNIMKTIGVTILFLFCLILSTPFTTSMLYDDLRVYYSYENDALDSSINANNGVLTDGSYVAGKVGQAIELNALGEWFEIAETDGLYNFTDEVTICTWAKVADHLQYFIYTTNIGANTVMSLGLNVPSNKIGAYDGSSWLAGTGQNVNDAWTHVCWLFKDTTFTSYVDGVLAGTDGGYRGWLDMLGEIGISGSANQYLTGEVDETAIWNRSLSENEIEALYNGGDGCAYENLTNCQLARDNIAYYRFQTDADDDIGGYDGVLEGTPTQTTGIIGQAYNYDGGASDDAIKIGTSLASGQAEWSYSVWVKQETLVTVDSRRILYGYSRWNAQSHNTDGLAYHVEATGSNTAAEGSQNTDLNNWIHIIGVYDGVEIKLYVNNVLEDTIALTGNVDTGGTTGICIGGQCDSITPNAYWIGDIDELSFWNRSLDVDEIDFLYAGGSPTVQQQYPYNGSAPIDYFEITAYDPLYQSYHQVFNATLCDSVTLECTITQWNTTTGTLTTSYEINYTKGTFAIDVFTQAGDLHPFNITGGYDINASGNLLVNLTNQSATTGNDYNYTITINVSNIDNGNVIDNFTSTFLKNSFSLTQSRINASGIVKYGVTGGVWELFVNASGYAYYRQNYTITADTTINVSLYPANSVTISIFNESSGTKITQNITVQFTSSTNQSTYNTLTGGLRVENLTPDTYTVTFNGANWSVKTYTITVGQSSHQFLNAYLGSGYSETEFTITDQLTSAALSGALVSELRFINGSWATTESKLSDIVGKVVLQYHEGITYRFIIIMNGYITKDFELTNIDDGYNIPLTPETVNIPISDFSGVGVDYYPKAFSAVNTSNFTFIILSPQGFLTSYNLILSYPSNNVTLRSGTNALGEPFTFSFVITNPTIFDVVRLDYQYTTSSDITYNYSETFEIFSGATIGNNTFMNLADTDYGLGMFEQVLIASLTVIITAGLAFSIAGMSGAGIVGMFVYGFFIWIGFLPLWTVVLTFLTGFVLLFKWGGQL